MQFLYRTVATNTKDKNLHTTRYQLRKNIYNEILAYLIFIIVECKGKLKTLPRYVPEPFIFYPFHHAQKQLHFQMDMQTILIISF